MNARRGTARQSELLVYETVATYQQIAKLTDKQGRDRQWKSRNIRLTKIGNLLNPPSFENSILKITKSQILNCFKNYHIVTINLFYGMASLTVWYFVLTEKVKPILKDIKAKIWPKPQNLKSTQTLWKPVQCGLEIDLDLNIYFQSIYANPVILGGFVCLW